MSTSDRGFGYSRLETDTEFRARLPYVYDYQTGDTLDDYAWRVYKMQRRIIRIP